MEKHILTHDTYMCKKYGWRERRKIRKRAKKLLRYLSSPTGTDSWHYQTGYIPKEANNE